MQEKKAGLQCSTLCKNSSVAACKNSAVPDLQDEEIDGGGEEETIMDEFLDVDEERDQKTSYGAKCLKY